jgi:hypothetical protein
MKKHGSQVVLFFLCVFFSLSSVADISTSVDSTPECLKKVNWEKDASTPADDRKVHGEFFEEGTERVYVASKTFDKLSGCAYENFRDGIDGDVPMSEDVDLDFKFHTYSSLAKFRDLDERVDLLLGGGSASKPTVFVHANSPGSPIATIIHDGVSYTRNPNFSEYCDGFKENTEDYEWCTGKRQPGPQDPRLRACANQYCPKECTGSACGHIRDVQRPN